MGERKRRPENCEKQVLFPGRWHKEPGPVCCPSRRMEESSLMQAGLAVTFLIVFWTLSGHARALTGFVSRMLFKVPWRFPGWAWSLEGHRVSFPHCSLSWVYFPVSGTQILQEHEVISFLHGEWMQVTFSDSWPSPSSSKLVSYECLYPSVAGIAMLWYALICLYVCHLPNLLTICCSKNSFLEGKIVT